MVRATHIESLENRRLLSATGFSTIAAFGSAPQGILPQSALATDTAGDLFGVASAGGASGDGTVFEVANGSSTITTLASFDGTNGQKPEGGVVVDSSGDVFGATSDGGAAGDGTVFEIVSGSNTITTLASFDGTDGSDPNTGLILDGNGNLFGTTTTGGANGDGTVFEVAHGSNAITTLASFDGADGSTPQGELATDSAGDLFGTASTGGSNNDGVIFELASGSSSITALASFNGTDGQAPDGGVVIDSGGNLFGDTSGGGANTFGVVFEIPSTGGALTTIASFTEAEGQYPQSGLILDGSGNLFGTATAGGASDGGDVFEVASGSTTITPVASFNFTDGALPESQPVLSNGNLFGVTDEGGVDAVGSVYEITSGSSSITSIASFQQSDSSPTGTLLVDGSGNLFGATGDGDGDNAGAVFEIPSGSSTIDTLATFNGANGDGPSGGVVEDGSGDFFGTTGGGGPEDDGTVFEIVNGSNTVTTLATFDGTNGKDPEDSSLVLDSSGDVFGTTSSGGSHDDGTIFEIVNGSNTVTTLASFDGTNGANPFDGVIRDSQGDLFGTAESGGASGLGDVFELVSGSGSITALASFDGANGEGPSSGLAIDGSGDLFGTTQFGGPNNDGTVFEIASGSTTVTTLASFNGVDGEQPEGYVSLDSSGNVYGTTEFGGANGDGTVFEVANGSNAISTLYTFTGATDGGNPIGGVTVSGSDLFGTASNSGGFGGGTVFELAPPSTRLAFAGPIAGISAGGTLAPIVINIENQAGQIDTSDDSSVTLTIATGPTGVTVNQTVAAVNGVATFSGLSAFDTAGTYTFTATDGSDVPANSNPVVVSADPATQFVFATQPTNLTVGATFSSSIVVNAEDQFGNIDPTYNSDITLGSKIVPTGVTFTPITVTAVKGVATFSSVPDFTTEGGYKLKATQPGFTPAKSNKFFVLPPPSAFGFPSALPNLTAGGTFATSVIVDANNSDGSLDTAYDGNVTLGLKVEPTGVTFTPITVAAVNGVATFPNIPAFDTVGGYKLKATQPGTAPGKSNKFFVTAGAAATLAFVQVPSTGLSGAPLLPPVTVDVEDAFGNLLTTDTSEVTISVESGPGTLSGVTMVAAVGGVASFADLVLSASGNYVLNAADSNTAVAAANSAAITVN